jgi:hypothetical protein
MGAESIMAAILEHELRKRGMLRLTQLDYEKIVRSIVQRTAELDADTKGRDLGAHPSEQT